MLNDRLDEDFMQRAKQTMQPFVEEVIKENKEKQNKWKKQNPEKYRACQKNNDAKRREKFKQARAILTSKEIKEITEFYRNCPSGYEVDHIIPLSKGGAHVISNLQYLTKKENREKHAKWIGIEDGESYDPNFLLRRLERELQESEEQCAMDF